MYFYKKYGTIPIICITHLTMSELENNTLPVADAPINNNQKTDDTVVISVNTALDGYRLKNFYITNAFQWFVWMVFHFAVVFFFTFQIQNVALVWVFLGFANFVAFLIDIPIGVLQKFYSTKRLFIIASIAQLVATVIFFNFIYNVFGIAGNIGWLIAPEAMEKSLDWFFGSAINWVLIIVASICYGIAKEINDISTYWYILSNANPKDYVTILARNNITYWLWSLIWLLASGVVLSFSPIFAVFTLGIFIVGFMYFTMHFFDNANETVDINDIESFTVAVKETNIENVKNYVSKTIKKIDLPQVLQSTKYLFLKPKQETKSAFEWKVLFSESRANAQIIWKIMSHTPIYMVIYWTMSLVLVFGFWDTFAATFLIDFLDKVKPGWSYVLLAFIAVPALSLQEFMSKMAAKFWIKVIAFFGFGLSGTSLIAMGIVADLWPIPILICAIINSVWYAAGMALGQNQFLENYNKIYAKTMNLTEIDPNASAGPMKILQNLANVLWLVFWWLIISILWYQGFFIVFGLVILGLLIWSIREQANVDL